MSSAVIIPAKAKNTTYENKNIVDICGKPCIAYNVLAGVDSPLIDRTFVYSDGEEIRKVAKEYGATPLEMEVVQEHHSGAIMDAIELVKKEHLPDLDTITILLGNTVAANAELVTLSHEILNTRPEIDSVMSVWQAQDDHPFRALKINEEGYLESFLGLEVATSRQSYPPVYFYDQGVWTFRYENIHKREGPQPWWWVGKNSFPIIRYWVTGRDIHAQLDVDYCSYWVKHDHKDDIVNQDDIDKLLKK